MKFRITQFIFLLTTFLICCVLRHVHAGNEKTTLTPIRVPKGINFEWEFGISPDGVKVVYNDRYSLPIHLSPSLPLYTSNGRKPSSIVISELYRLSIQPVITSDSNAPAKPQVLLQEPIELAAQYSQPTWSPDGKWIAFYRWEPKYYVEQGRSKMVEKNRGVYVIPATGGEISLLAPVNRVVGKTRRMGPGGLTWSPDSKQLAFVSGQEGHADIYIVSLNTRQVLPFTTDHKDNVNPSWSPDGKKIAFFSRRGVWLGDGYRVWVKPVEGGKAVLMTKHAIDVPIWSPDGKMVAYKGSTSFLGKHGVIVSSVNEQGKASGTPTVLQQSDLNRIGKLVRWTAEGEILFLGYRMRPIHRDAEGSLPSEPHSDLTYYRKSSTLPTARIVSVKTNKLYTELTAIPPIVNGTLIVIEYSTDSKTVPEERLYSYRIYKSPNQRIKDSISASYGTPTNVSSLRWMPDKPGVYTFEVRVVEVVDRILNYSQSDSVTLTVVPPWYLNPWISIPSGCIIFALSISLIVFGFRYYARHRESQRLEQEA